MLLAQAEAISSVPASVAVLQEEEAQSLERAAVAKEAEASKRIEGQSTEQLSSALTAALSDRSKLIYQAGHGVYVEYTAPDGQLRMWYPNNLRVVKGSWGVRKVKGRLRACFHYSNAVNPVTQVFEPTECVSAVQTLSEADVLKSWAGDAFGLMRDRIPYRKGKMDMPSPETLPKAAPSN
jgi:hypothetical protein